MDPSRRLTYRELEQRSSELAGGLARLGLGPGDPVLLQLGNRVETIEAWYGLLKLGAVPVSTLAVHGLHELRALGTAVHAAAHLIDGDNPRLVELAEAAREAIPWLRFTLTARGGADGPRGAVDLRALFDAGPLEGIADGPGPDDLAVIQLSGGTTGLPKPIPRAHQEYWLNGALTADRFRLDDHSRVAQVLPIVHNAGIHAVVHASHSVGAAVLLCGPRPEEFLPFLEAEQPTDMTLVPGLVTSLIDYPGFLPLLRRLRRFTLSGAAVPPELFDRLEREGVEVTQQFGMGEGLCTATPPGAPRELRRSTLGYPLSARDEFIIAAEDGRPLPDGEVGELRIRGPYTIRGYFGEAPGTSSSVDGNGYLRTGDLATAQTAVGQRWLSIAGRVKDLINRGGEKVNAEELELLLRDLPGVLEVAAVAMPDPRLGERTCAYVVLAPGAAIQLADLARHLEARGVAKYKWPERVEIIDQLPRTPVGKVAKVRLREAIAARLAEEGGGDANR